METNRSAVTMQRGCGGWLAVSGPEEPIKIGVEAHTESESLVRLEKALSE